MKHVGKQNSSKEMITFKHNQAAANLNEILGVLDRLKIPSSPDKIRDYLERKALEKATIEATKKYEQGEITLKERETYIKRYGKTMIKRTIQKWLSIYTEYGYIGYTYNGYYLLAKGRREIQFRNFAKAYGTMVLNSLMDLQFPTFGSTETNLQKLVEIFGVYVVYCLIEATRLITADRNNNDDHWRSSYFDSQADFGRDGRFKDRHFINSWILHVLNPVNMLNLFLATIMNSSDNEDQINDEEIVANYIGYLEETGMSTFKKSINIADLNTKGSTFPPSTLDLIFKHAVQSSYPNQHEPAEYWKLKQALYPVLIQSGEDTILYESDNEKLALLKNILKQKYPLFCRQLEHVDKYFYSKDKPR